ncbi:uncharacterized protein [Leptinotarsa decemlineata]|uniref:uncharacterized protein n=1 Tax=Leptinotarsa decemlineata TaxID=7539 RepID=UPI003D30431F
MMYFLSKFCRICVQTDVKLTDLSTVDYDKVKLSDKLEYCTKMVVTRESFSSEICLQCITKLRVSYQFLTMCKKSTKTLQGYLRALVSKDEEKIIPSFINTELSVIVEPISDNGLYIPDNCENEYTTIREGREKRRRITKEQRCSLLKQLLTPAENNKHERDKSLYLRQRYSDNRPTDTCRGGLKNIINFTKNYEFGVNLDKNSNYEMTPLEKLRAFSNEFFRNDFTEFKNTILYIIENKDNLYDSADSEDDDNNFRTSSEERDSKDVFVKFEEVTVEPDIQIKTEDFEEEYNDQEYMSDLVECKQEMKDEDCDDEFINNNSFDLCPPSQSYNEHVAKVSSSSDSIHFLNNFVGSYPHRRTFSPQNVRCRTRDNPYINPMLRQQFLYRSFKCDKCSRYFKSPGYLKAHHSKVH